MGVIFLKNSCFRDREKESQYNFHNLTNDFKTHFGIIMLKRFHQKKYSYSIHLDCRSNYYHHVKLWL